MRDVDRPDAAFRRMSGRLGRVLGASVLGYLVIAAAVTPTHLILLLNGLALSVSAGVTTAYLPVACRALRRRDPSRGDVLGTGIFLAGLSEMAFRLESLVARDLAWPTILNTDVAAISIFLGIMALVAFLWAPYGDGGQVPREKWGLAGLVVAIGVAIAFIGGIAHHLVAPPPPFRFQ